MSSFLQQQPLHHTSHFLMGNSNEVQVFRIHQPQNAAQLLIRLGTVMEKKEMIFTLLTLNHGNQPLNNFLIAPPFSMNINYSQLSMHSWVWIVLFQQHLMCFQEAHLNNFFFFSCSGLLYIYILVFLSEISKAGLSCLFLCWSIWALSALFYNWMCAWKTAIKKGFISIQYLANQGCCS